jgi:hypothetical protein
MEEKKVDLGEAFLGVVLSPAVFIAVACLLMQTKLFITPEQEAFAIGLYAALIVMGVLAIIAVIENNWHLISLYGAASFNIAIVLTTVANSTLALGIVIAIVSLLVAVMFAFKLQQHKHGDAKIYLFVLALVVCGSFVNFIAKFLLLGHL